MWCTAPHSGPSTLRLQWLGYWVSTTAGLSLEHQEIKVFKGCFISCGECSVDVSVRRVGGAYGAKITRAHLIAAACALAAHTTQR